jgi:hypothetical protein
MSVFRIVAAAATAALLTSATSYAATFTPAQADIDRIGKRFSAVLSDSGINGVGRDILKCYADAHDHRKAMQLCVVYDLSALKVDRTMALYFAGAGEHPQPAKMFTNEAFDARMTLYGQMAFQGDRQAMQMVNAAASRVVDVLGPYKAENGASK